jgi:hypothetical protein
MNSKEPKLFDKIDENSKVRASGNGYWYCCTIPPHPFGEIRKDRQKKYIYLHRAILEKKLGRYLLPEEQADHIDGDHNNNDPDNIQLKELGIHQKEHVDRGNHFWTKSPMNKKRADFSQALAYRVLQKFFRSAY